MNKRSFILALLTLLSVPLFAQLNPALDVQHYRFAIQLNDSNNIIKAEAQITIKFLEDVNEVKLDLVQRKANGKGMTVINVKQDKSDINFLQDSQHVIIHVTAKKGKELIYTIAYEGEPADGLIISKNKR